MLKNEKGLTLIELLVVVVILGIISAIAVPSVGGLINNAKIDAHIANAQQMITAAKLYVANNPVPSNTDTYIIYLSNDTAAKAVADQNAKNRLLVEGGYLEESVNPFTKEPYKMTSYVEVIDTNGQYTYRVTLHPGVDYIEHVIKDKTLSQLNRKEYNLLSHEQQFS